MNHEVAAEMKRKGQYGSLRVGRGKCRLKEPLTTCISYLSQLAKIVCINTDLI